MPPSPLITNFPTLWQYLQSSLSYITPPAAAIFRIGIFWARANEPGAFITLAAGVPLGITGFVVNELFGLMPIQYLYGCDIMFLASCALMIGTRLVTSPQTREKVQGHVWTPEVWRRESRQLAGTAWYTNYRYLSAALVILCGAIVIW